MKRNLNNIIRFIHSFDENKLMVFKRVIALLMMLLLLSGVNYKKSEEVKKPVETIIPSIIPKVMVNGLKIRTGLPNFFKDTKR